jgi:hypothetical protein
VTDFRRVEFRLPFALPSLNVSLRQHWAERSKDQKMLHAEILAAFGPRYWPRPPFENARVTVTRISARTLDIDNLVASSKGLCDLFKPRTESNPLGMGFMVDDTPSRCTLVAQQEIGHPAETRVVIEELIYIPPVWPRRKPRRYPPKAASKAAIRIGRKLGRP